MPGRNSGGHLEATHQTIKFFETLLRVSIDGIVITDTSQSIILVNNAFCAFLGKSWREVIETSLFTWLERLDPGASSRWAELENHVHLEDLCRDVEFQIVGKDGIRHLSVNASLLERLADEDRGVIISMWREITGRKRAEEGRLAAETRIQQSRKFESLNVMAGGIAHSFNNMLTTVLGNLDLALAELPPVSLAREDIEDANAAAKRAAGLSSLMLTYLGQNRVHSQVIDMTNMLGRLTGSLKESASKNIVLKFNPSAEPILFKGNPAQIRNVVTNIVINAIEAIGDTGGIVTLAMGRTSCNQISLQQPFEKDQLPEGECVFFEVSDTGCGMDRATVAKIYDPFFTTKFVGRGLGLSAVLGTVRAHGGVVSVHSVPGKGTTVRVVFPAAEE